MFHPLPELAYPYDALEPHIDARTMEIHYSKHHQGYVNKLNNALQEAPDWQSVSIEELLASLDKVPQSIQTAVRNNGGGTANHTLFWVVMGPDGGGQPEGELAAAIGSTFASFDNFKKQFEQAALGVFGSGWAWLSMDPQRKLLIETTSNQDSPLMHGHKPILGIDLWEHAYYLQYQNRRADYVAGWWNVVNWDNVAKWFAGRPWYSEQEVLAK